MKNPVLALICLSLVIYCQANPIPISPPASMSLEEMYIEIMPVGHGLHATFTGDFTFDYIPLEVTSMLFPVPPDADNIRVWQDDIELPWTWSGDAYPTILLELPMIPGWVYRLCSGRRINRQPGFIELFFQSRSICLYHLLSWQAEKNISFLTPLEAYLRTPDGLIKKSL